MKTGKFEYLAEEAKRKRDYSQTTGNGLGGNGQIPHDLWRRIVPIAREFNDNYVDIAVLYSYLIANVNGQVDNDRYMSAFPSVPRIAKDTRIGSNRVPELSRILEASGLLKTVYDYSSGKKDKLYYPQYYTTLSDDEIRRRIAETIREIDMEKAMRMS